MVYPHQILEPGCIAREVLGFVAPQPNLRAGVAYIGSWAADHFFGEEIAEFKQKFRATLDSGLSAWKGIRQNAQVIADHVGDKLSEVSDIIQTTVNNTIENVRNTVTDVAATLEQTSNNITTAVDNAIENVKSTVGNAAKTAGNAVSSFFSGLFGGD